MPASTTSPCSLRALRSDAVLLTADKDFGDLVFRQRLLHSGVLLVRLAGVRPDIKARLIAEAFARHAEELKAGFAVLTRRSLRFRGPIQQRRA